MSVYTAIIDYLRQAIDGLGLYAAAAVGSLPTGTGICLYPGAGSQVGSYLNRGSLHDLYVTVNAAHTSSQTALDALSDIHSYLIKLTNYSSGDDWQLTNIETATAPNFIAQDDRQRYIYGSILKVSFYQGGN